MLNKKKKRRAADVLSAFIWVCVILIQMAVLLKLEVYAREKDEYAGEQITVRSPFYARETDCPEPEEFYRDETGTHYKRISWETVHLAVPSRTRPVQKEIFCAQVEGAEQIPETAEITVRENGRETQAICRLEKKSVTGERWQDDFSFPVTFHGYYSGAYLLRGYLIPGEGETPQLDGREALLLEEIGVSPEEYQVLDVQWDGEPYVDLAHGLCRNAVAFGRRLVRDYQLVYTGTAEFAAWEGWQTVAVYGAMDDEASSQEDGGGEGEVRFIQPKDEETAKMRDRPFAALWEKIIRTLLVTIAVGALLFFGGLFFLGLWRFFCRLRLYVRRRKADRKNEENLH